MSMARCKNYNQRCSIDKSNDNGSNYEPLLQTDSIDVSSNLKMIPFFNKLNPKNKQVTASLYGGEARHEQTGDVPGLLQLLTALVSCDGGNVIHPTKIVEAINSVGFEASSLSHRIHSTTT
jgi:hypothetical protein